MYPTLFDEFFKDFFRINKDVFRFNSPIERLYETYTVDNDTVLLTLNLLGIRPEDITVSMTNQPNGLQKLQISATTVNKTINKTYHYDNEFSVGSNRREVDKFEWESRDGILYIVIKYKKMQEIKKIESNRNKNLLDTIEVAAKKEEK